MQHKIIPVRLLGKCELMISIEFVHCRHPNARFLQENAVFHALILYQTAVKKSVFSTVLYIFYRLKQTLFSYNIFAYNHRTTQNTTIRGNHQTP